MGGSIGEMTMTALRAALSNGFIHNSISDPRTVAEKSKMKAHGINLPVEVR